MAIHYTGKFFRDKNGRFVARDRGLKSSIARNEFNDYQKWNDWLKRDREKLTDELFDSIGRIFKLRPEDREVFRPGIPIIEPIERSFKLEKIRSKKGKIDEYLDLWNDDYGNEDDYTSGGTRK